MRRRDVLKLATLAPMAGLASPPTAAAQARPAVRLRPGGSDDGFDPWVEVIASAFRHNAGEVSRLAGGRPILAVVKNNAYGLGDQVVGPIVDGCPQVSGLASVRPAEALAMRAAGVRKPMLTMAELGEEESAELVRKDVTLSCWLDNAGERLARIAKRAKRRVPVHLYLDTGMNREGMPIARALPWMEGLARQRTTSISIASSSNASPASSTAPRRQGCGSGCVTRPRPSSCIACRKRTWTPCAWATRCSGRHRARASPTPSTPGLSSA